MKLVFFGTPDFAIPSLLLLHKSKHKILAVVTTPDGRSGRGLARKPSAIKKKALELGYSICQPTCLDDDNFINSMKKMNADIYIVIAFKILPERLFNIPENGSVNLHASLLPKYRGSAPIQHAILNGDSETGVTTFKIEKYVDTGKILLQNKYDIEGNITAGDVYKDLADLGAQLILETLNRFSNNTLVSTAQDYQHATIAPKIFSNDAKIDWKKSTEYIHNHIRAFSPKPGAYTFYNKKRMKLFSSLLNLQSSTTLSPGEACYRNKCLQVGTGSGIIDIYEIQLEGKKKMSIENIINGIPSLHGATFE